MIRRTPISTLIPYTTLFRSIIIFWSQDDASKGSASRSTEENPGADQELVTSQRERDPSLSQRVAQWRESCKSGFAHQGRGHRYGQRDWNDGLTRSCREGLPDTWLKQCQRDDDITGFL